MTKPKLTVVQLRPANAASGISSWIKRKVFPEMERRKIRAAGVWMIGSDGTTACAINYTGETTATEVMGACNGLRLFCENRVYEEES